MDASHEAAVRRLRRQVTHNAALWPERGRIINVARADITELLDVLDAAGPLLAAADAYVAAEYVSQADRNNRVKTRKKTEALRVLREQAYGYVSATVQQPPAASPATMGAEEGRDHE